MSDRRTISQLRINGWTYDIKDKTSASNEKIDNLSQEVSNLTEDINNISETIAAIGKVLYPVGSIYLSINNTNPSTFLGGTWESLASGYALWTNADANALGTTATASNTGSHALEADESGLPAHAHSINHEHPNVANNKIFSYSYTSGNPGVIAKKFKEDSDGKRYVPTTGITNINHSGWADWNSPYNGNSGSTGGTKAKQGHTHTGSTPARIYVHAWKRIG